MVSVFRVALGRCSCTDPQPSYVRQLVCRELTRRLSELREKRVSELAQLPQYAETVESIEVAWKDWTEVLIERVKSAA